MVEDFIYHGNLVNGETAIPVEVAYATRGSLLVHFNDREDYSEGAQYDGLNIQTGDKSFEFGKCKVAPIHGEGIPGFAARLIFTDNVYDFNNIFSYRRAADMESYFQNLRIIKAQKGKVRESFRNYTSGLTFDLRVYKKFFDEFDLKYAEEPPEVYETIQGIVINTEGEKYFEFFNDRLKQLYEETADFTREEHELHGYYFRRQVWDLIQASEFTLRSNVKPRGYAGDSELMQMIYENGYRGETIFDKLMHKHPITAAAAQAVRNRKVMVPEEIHKALKKHKRGKNKRKFRVMSVACGPAKELEHIITSPDIIDKVEFNLLDQDPSALGEARESVEKIEARMNREIDKKYIQESVRTLVKKANLTKEWGEYDFIYSMGLYDYLTVRVGQAVTEKLYRLLRPGGTLLIGNYHSSNPAKIYMDYWLDWPLFYRNEKEMLGCARSCNGAKTKVYYEDTGCQMFLHVKKPEIK